MPAFVRSVGRNLCKNKKGGVGWWHRLSLTDILEEFTRKMQKFIEYFTFFLNVQNLIDDFAIFFYKKKQIVVDIAQGIV